MFQEFPKWRYNKDGRALMVQDVALEQLLTPDKDGWSDKPPDPHAKPEQQVEPESKPDPKAEESEPAKPEAETAKPAKSSRQRNK